MPDFSNNMLNVNDLPKLTEDDFIGIERRYRYPVYGSVTVLFGILLLIVVVASSVMWGPLHWVTFLMLIIWFCTYLLMLLFSSVRVEKMQYAIREQDVSFREGVFFEEWITIPFNRIQHCELSRGPFERMYKLASLKIYTAGGSGSDINIPGLTADTAQRLRDFVVQKIQAADEEE